jgi:cyclohexanecarboxylate-CoA ligase
MARKSEHMVDPLLLRPGNEQVRKYRDLGLWRDESPPSDLRRWARETPDAIAVTAQRGDSGILHLTYAEYATQVERFAGVLRALGVGPGQAVAIQLPNWWQVNALVLGCARLGATAATIAPSVRPRELQRMLARLGSPVCVTVDGWAGFDHAAALAEIAPQLPHVRHQVVLGERVGTGQVDLERLLEQCSPAVHGDDVDTSAEDPDSVGIVLFTSGTTGQPKGVLLTHNQWYAGLSQTGLHDDVSNADVTFTPHVLTHAAGLAYGNLLALQSGGRAVMTDSWQSESGMSLVEETGVTYFVGHPSYVSALVSEAKERNTWLPALRVVVAGGGSIPVKLGVDVYDTFGVVMQGGWAMTEVAAPVRTDPKLDPPDWSAHSDGRPNLALEIDLRGAGDVISRERPAELFVRGAGVALATVDRETGEVVVLGEHDESWYDTGDLAVPDGRGGIRVVGRAVDRIGVGWMIPAADVEDALRGHPDIDDAALVGYGENGDKPCAVVVARGVLTIEQVRDYLDAITMTEWYQPTRLERVPALPRTSTGKVQKELLRRWLRGEAELPPS